MTVNHQHLTMINSTSTSTSTSASASASANATPARFCAVGAGRMGRGIAIACAYAGHRLTLVDLRVRTPQAWAQLQAEVNAEVRGALQSLVQLSTLRADQVDTLVARVQLAPAADAPAALAAAELLFEGVPETLEAKRDAFAIINRHCRDDAIITSTTSSILVTQLATLVRRPERFLNMHWLNPAYIIPVVELSTHPGLAPEVLARTKALMEGLGKLPVVCGPTPGYIVPRLQALVMNEAARMVAEGVAPAEEIDKATRYGMGLRFAAMGVVEFIDFGGVDILYHASREMASSISAERYTAPPIVGQMFDEGRLGLKTASGFYNYEDRDLGTYRQDVMARVLALLQHAGLWRAAAESSLD